MKNLKQQRYKLRRYHLECENLQIHFLKTGEYINPPDFPIECIGMTCGAKTRAGTPCKRKDLFRSGRCKLHGGMSTGPKTLEGKRRSALNTGKTYEELIANKK